MPPKIDTPTKAEIVEVLATKGMGWRRGYSDLTGCYFWEDSKAIPHTGWNPLADLNAVREVEAWLTDEQWSQYSELLANQLIEHNWKDPDWRDPINEYKTIRHADPRTCCLALWQVLEGK